MVKGKEFEGESKRQKLFNLFGSVWERLWSVGEKHFMNERRYGTPVSLGTSDKRLVHTRDFSVLSSPKSS